MGAGALTGVGQGIQQALSPKNVAYHKALAGRELTPFEKALIGYDPDLIRIKRRMAELQLEGIEEKIKEQKKLKKTYQNIAEKLQKGDKIGAIEEIAKIDPMKAVSIYNSLGQEEAQRKAKEKLADMLLYGIAQTTTQPVNLPPSPYLKQPEGLKVPQTTYRKPTPEEIYAQALRGGEQLPAGFSQLLERQTQPQTKYQIKRIGDKAYRFNPATGKLEPVIDIEPQKKPVYTIDEKGNFRKIADIPENAEIRTIESKIKPKEYQDIFVVDPVKGTSKRVATVKKGTKVIIKPEEKREGVIDVKRREDLINQVLFGQIDVFGKITKQGLIPYELKEGQPTYKRADECTPEERTSVVRRWLNIKNRFPVDVQKDIETELRLLGFLSQKGITQYGLPTQETSPTEQSIKPVEKEWKKWLK